MSIDVATAPARVRRERGAAESARFALLGLLVDSPAHGYDLARYFAPNSALGTVIRLSASHLYALLNTLERDGLIEGEQRESGSRPQRRVYHLTELGATAVSDWVVVPVSHPRDMRIDFPLKLYIARRLGPDYASDLIASQRDVFRAYLDGLKHEHTKATQEDAAFVELIHAGRAGRAQAALLWLDHCEAL